MIAELLLCFFIVILLYFLYKYIRNHLHFMKRGIKFCRGVPFFGNVYRSSLGIQHFMHDLDDVYRRFPDEKYVGYVDGTKRVILIRDPELAKLVLVKDFNHFVDRRKFFPVTLDPLIGNSLLTMEGNRWHKMRAKLRTSFTSAKIKNMMPFMVEVSNKIIDYVKDNMYEPLEVLDLMRLYSNEIITSTTFGISLDTIKNKNNDFYEIALDTLCFDFRKMLCIFFISEWPSSVNILKMIGIYLTAPKYVPFLRNALMNTIEYRRKNNIIRHDLIDLLLNLKVSSDWNFDEIVGQSYFMFLAGFETVAGTVTMCIHMLVLHPEVQEKLYQEVKNNEELHGISYESINQLDYLDRVVKEAERIGSTAVVMDRECTKTYDLPPPREGGKSFRMYPGDIIYYPPYSVHRDSKYFPDPEIFNPERFSEENKSNIVPYSFVPFGEGPRNCLGMRFATLELKVIIYQLVLNFKMKKCSKTAEKINLRPGLFNVSIEGGLWIQFESRN